MLLFKYGIHCRGFQLIYVPCFLPKHCSVLLELERNLPLLLGPPFRFKQWFLRDFTGMLGGILFTFYQGSNLDSNAKMWRLVADFMNDLGMLMDLISPLYPSALVPIVCLGSLSRSFTGVASGATRAALTQHFSLENNAADISAKEGSQETVATMIGMALGMVLAHFTGGYPLAVWVSFLLLTFVHMYANYMAVRCLSLTTLNSERGSLLLQNFMKNGQGDDSYTTASFKNGACMSVLDLSMECKQVKYLLLEREGGVHAVIHKEATPTDILQSFIHSLVLASLTEHSKAVHTESRLWMDESYNVFITKLQDAGWAAGRLLTPSIVWRAHWVHVSAEPKID
ncbi:hypothetical protein KSP40_PGU005002 [Platanthera guangdongensis]|uniref:Protein root UVB sensitive 3 n=1 Tax=Platanthera guangdongensis TaxID=2320717 RepID=A0ABR2LKY2_9ASPA